MISIITAPINKVIAMLFVIAFTAFVVMGYLSYIPSTVFYAGLARDISAPKLAIVIILMALSVFAIFLRNGNVLLKIFTWVFFVLANISFYTFYKADITISALNTIAFVVFCLLCPSTENAASPCVSKNEIQEKFVNICFAISIFVALYFFAANGFKFSSALFLFEGVYDVRFEVTGGRNFVENMLFSTTTKFFALIAFGSYVQQRRIGYAILTAACLAVLYSTSAQKSILFFTFITFLVCYPRDKKTASLIGGALTILLAVLCFVPQTLGSASWAAHSFLTRRLLLIPAWLNDQYVHYYADRPLFLSHSILKGVFGAYDGPGPTWEMGYYLWGFRTSLNNGIFSDGFVNFGFPGAILYLGIALGAVLYQARFSHPAIISVLLVYVWQLNNSALITTFVTHGFAAFLVCGLFFFRARK